MGCGFIFGHRNPGLEETGPIPSAAIKCSVPHAQPDRCIVNSRAAPHASADEGVEITWYAEVWCQGVVWHYYSRMCQTGFGAASQEHGPNYGDVLVDLCDLLIC